MVLNDSKEELDLTLNFHHENHNYAILPTTNNMKCFNCGEVGHLVRACPNKREKLKKKKSFLKSKVT